MKESGDREGSSVTGQGVQNQKMEVTSAPSPSRIDVDDLAILSATREGALTLLQISERTDMPIVECLKRAKNLENLGLLSQVPNTLSPEGLHYYTMTRPDDVGEILEEKRWIPGTGTSQNP